MISDSIADFLVQIKNAYMAHKPTADVPYSKINERIAKLLIQHGYLSGSDVVNEGRALHLTLKYQGKTAVVTEIARVSKPGRRVYVKRHAIPLAGGGLGIVILSTPKGIMVDKEAKKLGLGGEVLCSIW